MTGRIEFEVKVCSMRSRSWKKIDEQWPDMEITWQNLVALNGDVYWLAADRKLLLAFVLATEKLRLYGTPVPPDNNLSTFLDVLGGLFCCIVHDYTCCEVYLMKKIWGREFLDSDFFKLRRMYCVRSLSISGL